ncbi:heavy metal transporter [Streptomyces sp. NPDC051940]|uniref:heavy metal transporter n=1 Tax=Streptomyces sp. NPDC051940 TaxID=3155675 RepID=UPI00342B2A3F
MEKPVRRRRHRALLALVVLLGLGGYLVIHLTTGGGAPPRCVVTDAESGETREFDPEQTANAATISAVASARGLPSRAVTIALATAMQESALHNIRHGDRDSLGLFQQRPSQGWGTRAQILDPVYSAGKFYEHLAKVRGYTRLPLTVAAQKVQRSGFPQAYAKHEPAAALLAAALTGREQAALTCTTGPDSQLAGDPADVRERLAREFGRKLLAAEQDAGGGGRSAQAATGGLVTVAPGRSAEDAPRRGWELAHWAVAHATELGLAEVAFGDRVWSADDSGKGWRRAAETSAEVRIVTAQ